MFEQFKDSAPLGAEEPDSFEGAKMGACRDDLLVVFVLVDLTESVNLAVLPNLDSTVLRLWVNVQKDSIFS
jgi:hypothetical protein